MPWRINGKRVYKVKSMSSRGKRKTFKTKTTAKRSLKTRRKGRKR